VVLSAVHHEQVVAHRVAAVRALVLAVAVTVGEVALIVTPMISGATTRRVARDTAFAAVTIACNGIVGGALLVGALRRRRVTFNAEGTGTALATIGRSRSRTAAPRRAPAVRRGRRHAALVLRPESLAATRAARRDRVQTSLNLALGCHGEHPG
jgi:Ca2+:H+ antiporter